MKGIGIIGGGDICEKRYLDVVDVIVEKFSERRNYIQAKNMNIQVVKTFDEIYPSMPEIWIIATPSGTHREILVDLIEAGHRGPVLIEKLLDINPIVASSMYKIARDGDCIIHPILQNRCQPSVRKLRSLITDGKLGRILNVAGMLGWKRTREDILKKERRYHLEKGGGIGGRLIHQLDVITHLLGLLKVQEVSVSRNYGMADWAPDTGVAFLCHQHTPVTVFASDVVGPKDLGTVLHVYGTEGKAKLYGYHWENLKYSTISNPIVYMEHPKFNAHQSFVQETFRRIRENQGPLITKRETLSVIDNVWNIINANRIATDNVTKRGWYYTNPLEDAV